MTGQSGQLLVGCCIGAGALVRFSRRRCSRSNISRLLPVCRETSLFLWLWGCLEHEFGAFVPRLWPTFRKRNSRGRDCSTETFGLLFDPSSFACGAQGSWSWVEPCLIHVPGDPTTFVLVLPGFDGFVRLPFDFILFGCFERLNQIRGFFGGRYFSGGLEQLGASSCAIASTLA